MRKYYLAGLNITIGEYEVDTAIRFSSEHNPELTAHDIAEDFYGKCCREEDEVYYFNGGEVAVEVGCIGEVSKEVFDAIPNQVAPVLWGKEV